MTFVEKISLRRRIVLSNHSFNVIITPYFRWLLGNHLEMLLEAVKQCFNSREYDVLIIQLSHFARGERVPSGCEQLRQWLQAKISNLPLNLRTVAQRLIDSKLLAEVCKDPVLNKNIAVLIQHKIILQALHAFFSGCTNPGIECVLEPQPTVEEEVLEQDLRRNVKRALPFRRFDIVIYRKDENILEFVQLKGIVGRLPWPTLFRHYSEFIAKIVDYIMKISAYEKHEGAPNLKFSLIFYISNRAQVQDLENKIMYIEKSLNDIENILREQYNIKLQVTYKILSELTLPT